MDIVSISDNSVHFLYRSNRVSYVLISSSKRKPRHIFKTFYCKFKIYDFSSLDKRASDKLGIPFALKGKSGPLFVSKHQSSKNIFKKKGK